MFEIARPIGNLCSSEGRIYRVVQKTDPLVYFDDNFGKYGLILTIFSLLQQENLGHTKFKLFQPPHLYYVATLPSETNTDAGINVTITSLLCLCIICYTLMLLIIYIG